MRSHPSKFATFVHLHNCDSTFSVFPQPFHHRNMLTAWTGLGGDFQRNTEAHRLAVMFTTRNKKDFQQILMFGNFHKSSERLLACATKASGNLRVWRFASFCGLEVFFFTRTDTS